MKAIELEYLDQIRHLMKQRRVALNLRQEAAARRAGVSIRTIQHFEQTGQIGLLKLLKLMVAYRMERKFLAFINDRTDWTIEELERAETRKQVR